jgi:TonB family protein
MKLNAFLVLCCLFLFACAPTKTDGDAKIAPIEVTNATLPNYWVSQTTAFMMKTGSAKTPTDSGVVTLRYLIDTQGNIQNATVVESTPMGVWDEAALNALKNLRYTQSVNNPQGLEVVVTTEMTFKGSK